MIMLRVLSKSLFFALLLMISGSQVLRAEIKQYQYDGKLPFVQMMLNMMVAMGILDRIPVNGFYGSSAYPGASLAGLNNPYARALALRGLSPGLSSSYLKNPYALNSATRHLYGGYPNSVYGNNPFLSSPWLQSPWSQPALNGVSPLWGNPSWGVLPLESYPLNNYAANGLPWGYPNWSENDLTGWVNEPWETSTWNPKAEDSSQSAPSSSQSSPGNNASNEMQQPVQAQQNRMYNSSPLAKLAPPDYRNEQQRPEMRDRPPAPFSNAPPPRPSNSQSNFHLQQKPCVTDFCGLKKPDLDGFWVAQNGEMLGIKNQQFLWSDGASRYLTGLIKVQNEYLLASVEGREQVMRFKYKLAGNHLLTLQPDGVMREFTRMSAGQYYDQYQDYGQNYANDYYK